MSAIVPYQNSGLVRQRGNLANYDGVTINARPIGGNGSARSAGRLPGTTGRMAGLGKLAGRVAPVAFAGLDYAMGKAEGEDDIRAVAGAGGALVGGMKGAASGAAMGSVAGPVGTVVGGLIGGTVGSFAGGWGADRVDDLVRGRPQRDRDNAPDTRLGMLGGVANSAMEAGETMNPMAVGRGLAIGAGVIGAGTGLTAGSMKLKSMYDDATGNNEYDYRTGQNINQFQGYNEQAIDRDLERTARFGKDAGRFKREMERDQMNQEYQNEYGLNAQQYASQERINTAGLRASQAENSLREFNQSQNVAAQRAASILNTRFY